MFLMVERDRLYGPEANAQTDEDEEYQDPRRQSNQEEFHGVTRLASFGLSEGSPGSQRWNHK